METGRQLDVVGRTGVRSVLFAIGFVFSLAVLNAQVERGKDSAYDYGIALAQRAQLDDAHTAFLAGYRQWPGDPRFPTELAGVAFKQKHYAEAVKWLRRAMRLTNDPYVADFLATIYYLQGNHEAALQYWNRVDKPRIESVKIEPGLRVDPVLLDRAFTFAPGETLRRSDFATTRTRISGLGIFPVASLGLAARADGRFDVTFAAAERNGFGSGKLDALVSAFRGIGYQTVYPEYFNLGHSAINLEAMLRWDAQKRRLMSSVSGPMGRDARRRYQFGLDLRNENWDLRSGGAMNLTRRAASVEIVSFSSGAWNWSTGAELSHRNYRNVAAGAGLPPDVLLKGYALKQLAQVSHDLWRVPDRRFENSVRVSSEAAKIWSAPAHFSERLQVGVNSRWSPSMAGDDYTMQQQIRAGRIFGEAPFDELFMLGMERDSDLWLRAHVGTRDGRKGSAPLGRDYFLANWEIDKNLYRNGLISVKLSPFLDTGRSSDSHPGLGTGKWLWDTGVQAKLRALGVGIVVIYGKDLRSGRNSFYLTTRR